MPSMNSASVESLSNKMKKSLPRWWKKRFSASITESDPSCKVVYLGNVLTGWAKGKPDSIQIFSQKKKNYFQVFVCKSRTHSANQFTSAISHWNDFFKFQIFDVQCHWTQPEKSFNGIPPDAFIVCRWAGDVSDSFYRLADPSRA